MTERDNATPCPVRIGWAVVFLLLVGESVWSTCQGRLFDFASTARGWTEFLGAAGATIAAKAYSEPKSPNGQG